MPKERSTTKRSKFYPGDHDKFTAFSLIIKRRWRTRQSFWNCTCDCSINLCARLCVLQESTPASNTTCSGLQEWPQLQYLSILFAHNGPSKPCLQMRHRLNIPRQPPHQQASCHLMEVSLRIQIMCTMYTNFLTVR